MTKQPMSNIDKQALREAAEKALPAMKRLLMMPNDELFDEALLNVDGDVDAANVFNLLAGPETMLALLDELEALQSFRTAYMEWSDKTDWVQTDKRLDVIKPWGKHRADVLKLYIDHLESKLEAAEQERENWRTSFDNERFRADKLAAAFNAEHEQLVMANRALITQHIRANRAESRIAELEARTVQLPEALVPAIHNSGEPFMRPEPFGLYLNLDDVLKALRAAGINMEAE